MKHGLYKHPIYMTWVCMKQRCYQKSYNCYHNYGGRGISVCDEWMNDAKAFIDWALDNGWKPGLQLDRIDNDGDYCPENCRFVTAKENNRNTSTNRIVSYKGERHPVAYWAEKYGMKHSTLYYRLFRYGWSVERAITTPVRKYNTPHIRISPHEEGEQIQG